jgi:hypothetical protein
MALNHFPTSAGSTSETPPEISEKEKVPRYRRYCNKKCPAKTGRALSNIK